VQRQLLGSVPFHDLDVLVARTTAAVALHLLPMVQHVAVLNLYVVNNQSAHYMEVLHAVAEHV
jgi:hypothetical protein